MTRLWMIFPIKTSMRGSPAGHPGCPAPLASSTLLASLFGPAGNRRWEPRAVIDDLEKFQYVVARPSQRRFLDQRIYIHRWHRYTYYQIVVVISSNNNHSVYLYVYVCVYVCTWNHRTSQFAKACAYIHIYIYVYMYIYIYINIYIYMLKLIYIYMCVCLCTYIYIYMKLNEYPSASQWSG